MRTTQVNELITTGETSGDSQFSIATRYDMSFNAFLDELAGGKSGVRMPHSGSLTASNIVAVDQGVTTIVFDRQTPAGDRIYFPQYRVVDGGFERIGQQADDHRLVAHLGSLEGSGERGELAAQHFASVKEAFPHNDQIVLAGEYMTAGNNGRNGEVLREVLQCLVKHDLGQWTRRVDEDGDVHRVSGSAADLVRQHGVFRDGTDETQWSGMLLSTGHTLLVVSVMEALAHNDRGSNELDIYHLAGTTMMQYVPKMAAELQAMYELCRRECSFGQELPPHLRLNLVPTSHLLAVPADRRDALEAALDAYCDRRLLVLEHRLRGDVSDRRWAVAARLSRATVAAAMRQTGLFKPEGLPLYPSHYDALKTGGFWVPEETLMLPAHKSMALTRELGELARS